MRRQRAGTLFVVTGLAAFSAARTYAGDKAPTLSGKGCQVDVTGVATASWKGTWKKPGSGQQGKVGATSDYWLSDSDLRLALGAMAGALSNKSKAEQAKQVDEAMKKDPRLVILLLNCITDDSGIFLNPSSSSKYQDVPLGPKSYKVVDSWGNKATPGQFTVMSIRIKNAQYRVEEGTLDIKKFDHEGVAGTFSIKAAGRGDDRDKKINVVGAFDFPCTGAGGCALK